MFCNRPSCAASPSLPHVLRRHLDEHAGQPLFTLLEDGENEAGTLTFAQLDLRARAVAVLLQERGLAGERALLTFPTSLDFIVAFFGCLYAGVVAVPVAIPSPRKKATFERLAAIARDARPRLALTTPALKPIMASQAALAPGLEDLPWISPEEAGDDLAGAWRDPGLERKSLAFLQYTSGSTAFPKGVMISHGNIVHNAATIRTATGHEPGLRGVSWLPLHHDMGLIGMALQQTYSAMHSILMPPLYFLQSPIRWLRAIDRYRSHTSGAPNFAYDLCLRRITPQQCEGLDLSCWRVAFNGAEPIRAQTLERFAEKFAPLGFRPESFFPCYGLAEATLLVSGSPVDATPVVRSFDREALAQGRITEVAAAADDGQAERGEAREGAAQRLVGCGRLWLDQQVAIVDPTTRARCPPDRVGEIWLAGGSVGLGYWELPEQSAESFGARFSDDSEAGPFFRTGDLGFLRDGELFITGRLKDLIILAGLNYYPQDIEKMVEESHPSLRPGCSAAFSVDLEGEERLAVLAEVRSSEGLAEVASTIRRAVSESHELRIHVLELIRPGTLPKTTSGKVQRGLCRSLLLDGRLSRMGSSGSQAS